MTMVRANHSLFCKIASSKTSRATALRPISNQGIPFTPLSFSFPLVIFIVPSPLSHLYRCFPCYRLPVTVQITASLHDCEFLGARPKKPVKVMSLKSLKSLHFLTFSGPRRATRPELWRKVKTRHRSLLSMQEIPQSWELDERSLRMSRRTQKAPTARQKTRGSGGSRSRSPALNRLLLPERKNPLCLTGRNQNHRQVGYAKSLLAIYLDKDIVLLLLVSFYHL